MTLFVRPACPECSMNMIITKGFNLTPEHRTFECLRCGHIKTPQPAGTPARVA